MKKIRVLFVCVGNTARSQMAEALLNYYGEGLFEVESAGLEPGTLNPYAVNAMAEMDIDISKNKSDSVFEFLREGKSFNHVITVCDESNGERCPVFPGNSFRLHWGFDDPATLEGSEEDKLARTIEIRDQISEKVKNFVESVKKIISD